MDTETEDAKLALAAFEERYGAAPEAKFVGVTLNF